MKRRIISIVLVLGLAFGGAGLGPAACAADTELASVSQCYTLDLWHHSAGYWKVGNAGSDKITISDSELEGIGGLTGFLEANNSAQFSVALPAAVNEAIAAGKDVRWKLEADGIALANIFNMDTLSEIKLNGGEMIFSVKPVFNIVRGMNLGDFVSGLDAAVPLVDKQYGSNIFALYGRGLNGAQGWAMFNEDKPDEITEPYMHPCMISGCDGALKSGYTVYYQGGAHDSDGLFVGDGTFSSGGACGLSFNFPVRISFYEYGAAPPQDQPEPEEHSASIEAKLALADTTFVGHPADGVDCSVINYDGQSYSAAAAYMAGLASNGFLLLDSGSFKKNGRSAAQFTFNEAGVFRVKLTVSSAGESASDTKAINVLPCPSVTAVAGGIQKQNRRQVLSISAAQDPAHPISELVITISDSQSGESVTINKRIGEIAGGAPQNTEHIKCRAPLDAGSDEYFVRMQLEFLSKFDTDRVFNYTVSAKDERGQSGTCSGSFSVAKDLAPQAQISIEESYYRSEGGGPAKITLSDSSFGDGDLLTRSWFYSENGTDYTPLKDFTDLSFGQAQVIAFEKPDVGKFYVKLSVRENWWESTLTEFADRSEELQDSVTAASKVDNVPPKVSLELFDTSSAEVLLLAEDAEAFKSIEKNKSSILTKLRENGLDVSLKIADLSGCSSKSGVVTKIGDNSVPFGFQGRWPWGDSFFEKYSATADEKRFYKTQAAWPAEVDYLSCFASKPYTVTAYSKEDLSELWALSLDDANVPVSFETARYGHDFEGKYLYILAEGSTVLIDKESGQFAACIQESLGFANSLSDNYIYSYKSDGVYKMPRSGGPLEKIISESIYAGEGQVVTFGGRVCFLCKNGSKLYVAHFNPQTEDIYYSYLEDTINDAGNSSTKLLGIDSNGCCIIMTDGVVRVFAKDGSFVKSLSGGSYVDPVYTADGRINYISVRSEKDEVYADGDTYYSYVRVKGIYNDYDKSHDVYSGGDFLTDVTRQCFGIEDSSGAVYLGFGAWYDYVERLGMPYGQRFMVFKFDPAGGTSSNNVTSFAGGLETSIEWGFQSQGSILLTAACNLPSGGYNKTTYLSFAESQVDKIARLKRTELSLSAEHTVVLPVSGELSADDLVTSVLAQCNDGEKALMFHPEDDGAFLSKELSLIPGRTYYYEYDTTAKEDMFALQIRSEKKGPASEGYIAAAEYFEDFNDASYEDFFTFNSAKVQGGVLALVDIIGYGYIGGGDSFSFTVPDGFKAVYSFDYKSYCRENTGVAWFSLSKDGGDAKWWDGGVYGNNFSGSHTGKELLGPGNYVLYGNIKSHTYNENNRCTLQLDNLKVTLLKTGTYPASEQSFLDLESEITNAGAVAHVKGSFTAPLTVQSYGLLDAEYIEQSVGAGSYTLNIPSGKTALFCAFDVNSSPYYYYNSKGSYRGTNVVWSWGGSSWTVCPGPAPSYTQGVCYPASHLNLVKYNLTGSQTVQHGNAFQTSGSVNSMRAVIADTSAPFPVSVTEGKYFLDGGLYYEDASYDGNGRLILNVKDDETVIGNFKVYYEEEGRKVYLENYSFKDETQLGDWTAEGLSFDVVTMNLPAEEAPPMIYKKGELIGYDINYYDYESDPSKQSAWVYEHTPFNDGLNPISGQSLSEAVSRFYIDGKYVLTHRQMDNTGKAEFDYWSSPGAIVTFYILGDASAPQVISICTDPKEVEPGDLFSAEICIADKDGGELELTSEFYKDGQLIFTDVSSGLLPDEAGNYAPVIISVPHPAESGRYDIVAAVSDFSAVGLGSYRFNVKAEAYLEASVFHTAAWEANRLDYNARYPAKARAENVFWPGEKLVLAAVCGGSPTRVTAQLGAYKTALRFAGTDPTGLQLYEGSLWDKAMEREFMQPAPLCQTVRFTAYYSNGSSLISDVEIIFYYDRGYYRLHRLH